MIARLENVLTRNERFCEISEALYYLFLRRIKKINSTANVLINFELSAYQSTSCLSAKFVYLSSNQCRKKKNKFNCPF